MFSNIVKHNYEIYAPYKVMLPIKFEIYDVDNDNRFHRNLMLINI